jgi:hypothetical protein
MTLSKQPISIREQMARATVENPTFFLQARSTEDANRIQKLITLYSYRYGLTGSSQIITAIRRTTSRDTEERRTAFPVGELMLLIRVDMEFEGV